MKVGHRTILASAVISLKLQQFSCCCMAPPAIPSILLTS